ncbi:hypothetical protein [Rhizobium aegyptiacum]|uniref:hypothetical protein n=1 Tax=Rhizobium aegyptiacum TaxID=1764550 RepID=UPI0012E803DB|nr:hypothetical protein [Rhizobium aegyptiacum]
MTNPTLTRPRFTASSFHFAMTNSLSSFGCQIVSSKRIPVAAEAEPFRMAASQGQVLKITLSVEAESAPCLSYICSVISARVMGMKHVGAIRSICRQPMHPPIRSFPRRKIDINGRDRTSRARLFACQELKL